jgi:hypothetical protein
MSTRERYNPARRYRVARLLPKKDRKPLGSMFGEILSYHATPEAAKAALAALQAQGEQGIDWYDDGEPGPASLTRMFRL